MAAAIWHNDCSLMAVTVHTHDAQSGRGRLPWERMRLSALLPDDQRPPTIARRLLVVLLVFIPWLLLYEWVVYLGRPGRAFETYLPGETHWPIWQWTEVLYVSP